MHGPSFFRVHRSFGGALILVDFYDQGVFSATLRNRANSSHEEDMFAFRMPCADATPTHHPTIQVSLSEELADYLRSMKRYQEMDFPKALYTTNQFFHILPDMHSLPKDLA